MQPLIRPFGSGGSPADALYALAGFHARPSTEEPKAFPATREQVGAELAEKYDFHHQLSMLGDHPALLRGLGLVIDLQIRPDFVPATRRGPAGPCGCRSRGPRRSRPAQRRSGRGHLERRRHPETWCRLTTIDGQAFFSAVERSAGQDFAHGFLHLDPARYSAIAVDVDGLALKALNLAATLQRQEAHDQRPLEEPDRDGVPAARTGGVALVRTDRTEPPPPVRTGRAGDLHATSTPPAPRTTPWRPTRTIRPTSPRKTSSAAIAWTSSPGACGGRCTTGRLPIVRCAARTRPWTSPTKGTSSSA